MTLPVPSQETAEQLLAARRRERAQALRACRPHERVFLRQLPKSGYSARQAAIALGMSTKTAWVFQSRPRIRRVMELFLQDAVDQMGVSHASLVADLLEIKDRCMQYRQVLDAQGNPVLVQLKDGTMAAAYAFDPKNAIAAAKEIAELLKLTPARRIELTTKDGNALPAPIFHISFEDGGPGDYGIEVSGKSGSAPVSGALN